jgi:phosphate transport system permease protein
MVVLTLAMALPLGIMGGIFFSEYAKKGSKLSNFIGSAIDLLAGVPSIIFGIAALLLFRPWLTNMAAITMALTMTFIILPTIIRTTESALRSVKSTQRDAALALGASKSKTTLSVIGPQAAPSIISSTMLSIGRVIGESAALIMVVGLTSESSIQAS